ncbi:MAG: hypothetical protein LQ347_002719 [Umbilicaria vellea]|nr:MAG: hypothetical protein LQ347_002719 [Umbilicaria vellea]
MDDTIRPKAAAKRAAVESGTHSMTGKGSNKKSSVSAGSRSGTARVNTTASGSTKRKTLAEEDLSTLLDKPLTGMWADLAPCDRRIFCLQAGAPASGKTLPLKWSQLADQLDREGLLSTAQLKACGGTEALVDRYELVRLHVQELFGAADEATDRKDFKVLHAEGFDVYNLVGSNVEYVHYNDRDVAAAQPAKKPKSDHNERGGADLQMNSDTAEEIGGTVTPTANPMLLRSESEESTEIAWEEQIWGFGGIRPEELDGNEDYVESMEQFREDVSAIMDDVTRSQEDISEAYEEALTPVQPTDIILSDHTSTTNSDDHSTGHIERRPRQSASASLTASTATSSLSDSAVPVAKMTADMIEPETGLWEEQVSMSNSVTHEIDIAQQSLPPGPLYSVLAKLERERQKKIHGFAKVVEDGMLLPNQVASRLRTNGSPHSEHMAASAQLTKDLETQASSKPELVTDIFTQQSGAKPAATTFQVFEDQAGSTPNMKEKFVLHPISPGTDVPKENLEDDSDVDDHTSQPLLETFGARTHDTQLY